MLYVASPASLTSPRLVRPRRRAVYTPTIENAFRKEAYWGGEPVDLVIRDTAGQNEGSVFQLQFAAGAHGYVYVPVPCNCR